MPRVIVIGARRSRQGIGEFVARWFHEAGAEVCAIIGTEPETISEAQETLEERYGIDCRGYVSLDVALDEEDADIVAICSPIAAHHEQLLRVSAAGLDCLCEKPLWWGESSDRQTETEEMIDSFRTKNKILGLLTQWPFTLPAFDAAHPGVREQRIERFDMLMSPMTRGPRMLIDSLSHPISMLQALLGAGFIENAQASYGPSGRDDLTLEFEYRHAVGTARSTVHLHTCVKPPRPASFAINGHEVKREIDLPGYEIYFSTGERRVPVEDPVKLLVADFLRRVDRRDSPDRRLLIESVVNLEVLHAAGIAASSTRTTTQEEPHAAS